MAEAMPSSERAFTEKALSQQPGALPVLWIVVSCYNEQEVLPVTAPLFAGELETLVGAGKIAPSSRVLFVNDGSSDDTWQIIEQLAREDERYIGICQSRNRGHQNAVFAGLMEALAEGADLTISIDCDGQDDISAMERMVDEWYAGADVVYGVRSSRETDTWFKRTTAQTYYKLLAHMGVDVVYNHADYRLASRPVLEALAEFGEVNLYLRGMFPLVGFPSATVSYERHERVAGESHYPLTKMLGLAFDGITSLSISPIRMITTLGLVVAVLSLIGIIYALVSLAIGRAVSGWASTMCAVFFLGGVQLVSIGIIGEYIGKTYLETKHRPRYIISRRTYERRGRRSER